MPARHSSLRRLACDDITLDEETMAKAIEFLQSKLKPEELSHLKMMLKGEEPEAEDDEPEEEEKKEPKPDKIAADSRPNTFADRFPDAARIRVWL